MSLFGFDTTNAIFLGYTKYKGLVYEMYVTTDTNEYLAVGRDHATLGPYTFTPNIDYNSSLQEDIRKAHHVYVEASALQQNINVTDYLIQIQKHNPANKALVDMLIEHVPEVESKLAKILTDCIMESNIDPDEEAKWEQQQLSGNQ